MAAGDISFPRPGCKCIRWTKQGAIRHWIGARLAPSPTVANVIQFDQPYLYFLKFEATIPRFGNLWTAADYSVRWKWYENSPGATWPTNYGDYVFTGNLPTGVGTGFINLGYPAEQLAQVGDVGDYVFNTSGALASFTPASSYTITVQTTTLGGVAVRKWSDWLSPDRMEQLCREDLALVRPFNNTAIPRDHTFFGFWCEDDFIPRGGVYEEDDTVPGIHRDFLDSFFVRGTPGQFTDLKRGHALRFFHTALHKDGTGSGAFPPVNSHGQTVFVPLNAALVRVLVFQPGRYVEENWPWGTDAAASPADRYSHDAQCGLSDSTSALYIIDPEHWPRIDSGPIINTHRIALNP